MSRSQELIDLRVKKGGFRALIDAKCIECIYDPGAIGAGTWRKQVEDCSCPSCPLYSVRPITRDSTKARAKAKGSA